MRRATHNGWLLVLIGLLLFIGAAGCSSDGVTAPDTDPESPPAEETLGGKEDSAQSPDLEGMPEDQAG